jgi:hypothetical protein
MESARQGQVVLDAEEATVTQPVALVEVALERDPAAAALGPQGRAGQDAIIANLDQLADHPLGQRYASENWVRTRASSCWPWQGRTSGNLRAG